MLLLIILLSHVDSFTLQSNNNKIMKNVNNRKKSMNSILIGSNLISQRSKPLYLDFFGLGPTEFIIIIGASALLFGPDSIKRQLRNNGVKGEFVSSGWQAERKERMENLEKRAYQFRKARLFARVDKETEDDKDDDDNKV